jgi:hypothetical protein
VAPPSSLSTRTIGRLVLPVFENSVKVTTIRPALAFLESC